MPSREQASPISDNKTPDGNGCEGSSEANFIPNMRANRLLIIVLPIAIIQRRTRDGTFALCHFDDIIIILERIPIPSSERDLVVSKVKDRIDHAHEVRPQHNAACLLEVLVYKDPKVADVNIVTGIERALAAHQGAGGELKSGAAELKLDRCVVVTFVAGNLVI